MDHYKLNVNFIDIDETQNWATSYIVKYCCCMFIFVRVTFSVMWNKLSSLRCKWLRIQRFTLLMYILQCNLIQVHIVTSEYGI